jgi:hypothetical protein
MEGFIHKYGSIARLWIGPYVGVALTEAKYVEVSKLVLAHRKNSKENLFY